MSSLIGRRPTRLGVVIAVTSGLLSLAAPSLSFGATSLRQFRVPTSGVVGKPIAGHNDDLWYTQGGLEKRAVIGRITTRGVITEYRPPTARALVASAVAKNGDVWFAGSNQKLVRLRLKGKPDRHGRRKATIREFARVPAHRMIAAPDGSVWYVGQGPSRPQGYSSLAYGRISPSGRVQKHVLDVDIHDPGIAVTSTGAVWVAGDFSLFRLSATGAVLERVALPADPVPVTGTIPGLRPERFRPLLVAGDDGDLWFVRNFDYELQTSSVTFDLTSVKHYYVAHMSASRSFGLTSIPAATRLVDGSGSRPWYYTSGLGSTDVGRMDASGQTVGLTTTKVRGFVTGATVGPDGNLWLSQSGGRIGRLKLKR